MKKSLLIVMFFSFIGTIFLQAANSADITVEMLNKRDKEKMVYSEDVVRIEVGAVSYTHLTLPTTLSV